HLPDRPSLRGFRARLPCFRADQLRGGADEQVRGHRRYGAANVGAGHRVVRPQRPDLDAQTVVAARGVVGGRRAHGPRPGFRRDRAYRRHLPVVHGCTRPRRVHRAHRYLEPAVSYWPFDISVYAGLVVLYAGHFLLARTAGDAPRKHTVYFVFGLLTLWVALETPVDVISDRYLDSVHMLQHVLLAFVAPPLLLLGLSRGMAGILVRVPLLREITEPIP